MPARRTSTLNDSAPAAKKKRRKGLKSFIENIKGKWSERKEIAERTISNNNAQNEQKIIEVLESIDFNKSKLESKYLDFKTFESQTCGDLEKAKKDIINSIVSNNNYTDLNIKEFDKKVYEIAIEYRNAIANGHKNTAFAAKSALTIAIIDIRNQLKFIPTQWRLNYLQQCTDYLDNWIQLLENCISLDATTISLENSDRELQNKLEEIEENKNKYKEGLESDETMLRALNKVLNMTIKDTLTDPLLRSIFDNIIDFDISSRMVRFDIHMNNMQRRNNQMYATQVDMLRKNVQNIPIPKDPLSFQKFQQSVKNMIAEINKTDKQYEEFLNFIYEMDGVLESLENTQATKMQQKIVFERINQMVEAMNDINQKDSIDNMSGKELKERLGIKEKQEVQEVQTEQQYEEQEEENININ